MIISRIHEGACPKCGTRVYQHVAAPDFVATCKQCSHSFSTNSVNRKSADPYAGGRAVSIAYGVRPHEVKKARAVLERYGGKAVARCVQDDGRVVYPNQSVSKAFDRAWQTMRDNASY